MFAVVGACSIQRARLQFHHREGGPSSGMRSWGLVVIRRRNQFRGVGLPWSDDFGGIMGRVQGKPGLTSIGVGSVAGEAAGPKWDELPSRN